MGLPPLGQLLLEPCSEFSRLGMVLDEAADGAAKRLEAWCVARLCSEKIANWARTAGGSLLGGYPGAFTPEASLW